MAYEDEFDIGGLPVGFSMALSQNNDAIYYFANLSEQEKDKIIDKTHEIKSKQEMKNYVNNLIEQGL